MQEHRELIGHLQTTGDISLLTRVTEAFSKTLLVSAASYYEYRFTEILVGLYEHAGNRSTALAEFVRNQAIGQRFAQLFAWGDHNANRFFSFFGGDFRSHMTQKVRQNRDLEESIRAFLELGNLRNQLVHRNYAAFPLTKTVDEVFDLYQKARLFVRNKCIHRTEYEGFPSEISAYIEQSTLNDQT